MDAEASSRPSMLAIDFLIIGAGVAGLACAAALRRVGHRVLVLDSIPSIKLERSGGCRMAPNLSKILYHWGLQEELESITIKSRAIDLLLFQTGEILGTHCWDEEMLRETQGDFVFGHYEDLRQLLYKTAVSLGANVRFNAKVVSVDPDNRTVVLQSGEELIADVIVGADGVHGVTRPLLYDEDEEIPHRYNVYCTNIPKDEIMKDEELRYLYTRQHTSMFSWFGNHRAALGFPLGGKSEFALHVYGPVDAQGSSWEREAPLKGLQAILKDSNPILRKLGNMGSAPSCIPVIEYPDLDDWVHESGRLVLIGEAAHPLPPASIQQCAMTVEDGAVLAKLFSHLRTEEQINNFLYAFQDVRQPRCKKVYAKELGDINFMAMPPSEFQETRDQTLRSKRDAGIDVLDAVDEYEETPEWVEIKEVFGYDAEDEADNWWVEWGLLRERANGVHVPCWVFDNVRVEHELDDSSSAM